ncbi:hypothetical protein PFISCL1PPCAC_18310, partial [Pristionchus fissidentatus]
RLHPLVYLLFFIFLGFTQGSRPVNKYYDVRQIPLMKWDASQYKHEIVKSGGLVRPASPGSNFSVYPVESCGNLRISFVLQMQPERQ